MEKSEYLEKDLSHYLIFFITNAPSPGLGLNPVIHIKSVETNCPMLSKLKKLQDTFTF